MAGAANLLAMAIVGRAVDGLVRHRSARLLHRPEAHMFVLGGLILPLDADPASAREDCRRLTPFPAMLYAPARASRARSTWSRVAAMLAVQAFWLGAAWLAGGWRAPLRAALQRGRARGMNRFGLDPCSWAREPALGAGSTRGTSPCSQHSMRAGTRLTVVRLGVSLRPRRRRAPLDAARRHRDLRESSRSPPESTRRSWAVARHCALFVQNGGLERKRAAARSPLLGVLFSRCDPTGFGDIASGAMLIAWAAGTTTELLLALVFATLGASVLVSVYVAINCLAFWTSARPASLRPAVSFLQFAMVPQIGLPVFVKVLLYTVLPAAFVAFVPVEILRSFSLGKATAVAAVFPSIAAGLFRLGLPLRARQSRVRHALGGPWISVADAPMPPCERSPYGIVLVSCAMYLVTGKKERLRVDR